MKTYYSGKVITAIFILFLFVVLMIYSCLENI
jgi:hypothetical protein